jgi:hypothetical protein
MMEPKRNNFSTRSKSGNVMKQTQLISLSVVHFEMRLDSFITTPPYTFCCGGKTVNFYSSKLLNVLAFHDKTARSPSFHIFKTDIWLSFCTKQTRSNEKPCRLGEVPALRSLWHACGHALDCGALLPAAFSTECFSNSADGSQRMSSRRVNGSAYEGEQYSADDAFEEDVLDESGDDQANDFEEDVSDFEEGLDDGDAQYDDLDAGTCLDALSSRHAEVDEYAPDAWDDADLAQEARLHNSASLKQPRSHRAKLVLPAAVVNNALSSSSASLLTVAAFDVFLLSLMYAPSLRTRPIPTHTSNNIF